MVQDLFPNDTIVNIQEGGREVSLEPGKISKIEIESWPTGFQLNRGHKLRIVITSSWYPRYNRNLNTDEPTYLARDSKKAVQTNSLGPGHPSKITYRYLYLTDSPGSTGKVIQLATNVLNIYKSIE